MYLDKVTLNLRKLAKSNYYQTLYSFSKESGVPIFQNDRNFTNFQVIFMTYLAFYHTIETDIYMGEVDSRVLEDVIYEDAYVDYKNEERKKTAEQMTKSAKQVTKSEEQPGRRIQWAFRSKKHK